MISKVKTIIGMAAYLYSFIFSIILINKNNFPNQTRSYVENRRSFGLILFGDGINDFGVFAFILFLQFKNENVNINTDAFIVTMIILSVFIIYYYINLVHIIKKYNNYVRQVNCAKSERPIYYHLSIFKIVLKLLISVVICTIL